MRKFETIPNTKCSLERIMKRFDKLFRKLSSGRILKGPKNLIFSVKILFDLHSRPIVR